MEYSGNKNMSGGYVQENDCERILEHINFKGVPGQSTGTTYRSNDPTIFQPPPQPLPPPPPPYPQCVHFNLVEINRLRGESDMLKQELQNCYVYISRQNGQLQKLVNSDTAQKNAIEREQRKTSAFKDQMQKFQKQLLEHQVDLQNANARKAERELELEKLSKLNEEHEKKLKDQEQQIKKFERIISEQQDALKELGLEKMVLGEKLNAIREFVKQVNNDFAMGLETLRVDKNLITKDNGDGSDESGASAVSDEDQDEIEVKELQRNLNSLSALVRESLDEFERTKSLNSQQASSSDASSEGCKISLKRIGNRGSSEDWSIVPYVWNQTFQNEDSPPTLDCYLEETNDEGKVAKEPGKLSGVIQSAKSNLHEDPLKPQSFKVNPGPSCSGDKMETMAGVRKNFKYPCRLCRGRFTEMAFLKTHYRVAHKIPHGLNRDCVSCGETFPTRGDFNRHCQFVHHFGNSIKAAKYQNPDANPTNSLAPKALSSNNQQSPQGTSTYGSSSPCLLQSRIEETEATMSYFTSLD